MGGVRTSADAEPCQAPGDPVTELALHEEPDGLCQRVLRCGPGPSTPRTPGPGREEVLFTVAGRGVLHLGDERYALAAEVAAFVPAGVVYRLESPAATPLELVSVSGPVDRAVACGPRTPRHVHPYAEMNYILSGQGRVEVDGTEYPIAAGSAFFLPAGVPHCVENTGTGFLRLLGVFRPAGSPDRAVTVE